MIENKNYLFSKAANVVNAQILNKELFPLAFIGCKGILANAVIEHFNKPLYQEKVEG